MHPIWQLQRVSCALSHMTYGSIEYMYTGAVRATVPYQALIDRFMAREMAAAV